jgi:PAS domain S-box-containing protein
VSTNPDQRAAAAKRLATYRGSSIQFLTVAVWSADGRLMQVEGNATIAAARRPIQMESASADTTVLISPLSVRGDTVVYSATAPMVNAGRVFGYVVATRRMVSTAEGANLYGSLIGPSARLMFANEGDTSTIDLSHGHKTFLPREAGVGEYVTSDGVGRFYDRADIPGTPWRVLVDEPRNVVLAPSRRFALGMLGVAALFIIVATTVMWIVIRRALRPLVDVTDAVVDFAEGSHSERLSIGGGDEIARLGQAFNMMADRVASRTDALMDSIHEHQETERRYRALIDHLPDGVMVHYGRVVVLANPACARLFGEDDADALIGRPFLDFVEASDHELALERLDQVDEGMRVPMREMRLRRLDGKHVVVESTNLPLVLDGLPAIQTILHDVTDRHTLEDRMRQAQKMEAVGRLAGGIAHDFNNLLTVIDAHADFALHRVESEATQGDIEEIRRASASAARLTKQLLAFSRKQSAAPSPVCLTASVREVMVMLRRLIGDDIQVESTLQPDVWPVFADASHIEQMLLNLALNARDAMPQGGRLTFTTSNVEVGPDYKSTSGEMIPSGDYVTLTVDDTGTGMTPDVASRVFEPFFTTKAAGRGTGLGLSMVYGIVKQAGGFIWLFTEPGTGTSFKIMLPRHEAVEAARPTPRLSGEMPRVVTAHVLLVEDQPNVRAAVARSLKNAGLMVTDARDARAALQHIESGADIDIVITDMVMPGMSGAELASTLAAKRPELPVILMSGYSEELTNRQTPLPPNSRFVQKPVNAKRLLQLVTELLQGVSA